MNETFMNLTLDNLDTEHICCAISDKKHQVGVSVKKQWLKERIEEGHVFRKLDKKGKVFIEYAPIETAWVPVSGENYLYIYCLWVSGSFKGKGYVSTTKERVEALKKLHDAGIPTVVWLCPILPFINDTEENIKGILNYCIEAKVYGVICFGMGLTLREGNREYFYSQLDRLFPYLKDKYVQTYGMQYQINSPNNEPLMKLFHQLCEDNGIVHDNKIIFEYLSKFEEKNKNIQLSLFDEFL